VRHLPRFRARRLRNLVTVNDVVALVTLAFEIGHQTAKKGKYKLPAKRRMLLAMADDLRSGR
jgi:hypothetical protein